MEAGIVGQDRERPPASLAEFRETATSGEAELGPVVRRRDKPYGVDPALPGTSSHSWKYRYYTKLRRGRAIHRRGPSPGPDTGGGSAHRMQGVRPEGIREHIVEIHHTPYLSKQVLAVVTGWERQSFTTMEAQRVLARLGFICRRAGHMQMGGLRGCGKMTSSRPIPP